ncbi:MAG: glycosyltransferase family 4 protein [Desulfobacterales bacterium]|nr:glycosyltransferase family 4 protein [Desulfobacterales bacterium]
MRFVCINAPLLRKIEKPYPITKHLPIKVLHVTCSFDLGGIQRQIINLCTSPQDKDGYFIHEAIEYFPEHNYLYRQGVGLERERYVKGNMITRTMGRWILNPNLRSLQILQIYKLFRDFQTIHPDVVVGWGHEVAMLTFVAASIAKIPKILFCIRTFNPSYGWTSIGDILKKAHQRMVPYLDGIIVNSTYLKQDYAKWLAIDPDRIHVCPNGISSKTWSEIEIQNHRVSIRSKCNIPLDALVIINVGRFSAEKGQMVMVQAYHRVLDKRNTKDIYCLLCGDGPTQENIHNYVTQYNLKKLIMPGRIDAVHEFLCASDIFVMPSDFEGMPNAMMEAMAHGLPCISTNNTGALDIARDRIEALYVDVRSIDQMADKMLYLIEHPEERIRLGKNCQERLKEFSVEKMITRFDHYLNHEDDSV